MNIHFAAKALGGSVAGPNRILAPGPGHSANDRSLSVTFDGDRFVVHSFACDPWEACRDHVRRLLGLPDRQSQTKANQTSASRFSARPEREAEARRILRESLDPRGTWAEAYLAERGLRLPADPEILLRTLRFHPDPRSEGKPVFGPALICAFTPILADAADNSFHDSPPVAIHRIKGRGKGNKLMLGPTANKAVMLSPWWQVHETLNICEGVETALALRNEGANNPDDCYRPIWALGSAGAIAAFPVIARIRTLRIFADNDPSGTGIKAARRCAERWATAGKRVCIRMLAEQGCDYAD
jgi:putative DNA primase/helicase